MPSLTQVIKMDVESGKLRCERQAEYGYDTVEIELPAVISVGDAINEPRYPSLKAIMGAKKKPLEAKGAGDVGIEGDKVGESGSRTAVLGDQPAAGEAGRADHRGRRHRRDGREDRLLARGKEAAGMSGILTYVLHYEGEFNKNSLGAVSEAGKLAKELGVDAHAVVVGDDATDDLCKQLGNYGASKVWRAPAPAGLGGPVVDVMAKLIEDNGYDYVIFGGGLLGFEIGAGLAARLHGGVTMEVTEVKVQDGKLVAVRPILQDSAVVDVGYSDDGPAVIIGRLNAFEIEEAGGGDAEVEELSVDLSDWSTKATMVQRGEQRGADVNIEDAEYPRRRWTRPWQGRGLPGARGAARRCTRRRGCGHPRGGRRRLVPVRGPDRADRQDGRAEALPRDRHLRRDPAQGRHAVVGEHRRDQQGPERADLRVLRPRHRGRPAQDRSQADRGDQGEEGRLSSGWPPHQRSSSRTSSPARSS